MCENSSLFAKVYKYSPIGLVVVNANVELCLANNYILKLFNIDKTDYRGLRFGNLFKCSAVSAGNNSLCGTVEECKSCEIRNGVTAVLNKGLTFESITLNHSFQLEGFHEIKWFKVSACQVKENDEIYAVVSFVDITKEKQYEELLQHELTLDLATGTINKHALINILMNIAKYTRNNSVVSIGIIDMDNFKKINDNLGHLAGDKVLSDFSEITRSVIRKQDIIGRFGGEEFMFVFPDATIQYAAGIVKRISNILKQKYKKIYNMEITFSAGFTELNYKNITKTTTEDLINLVDKFLYIAKKSGKNRFISDNFELIF